MSTLSITVPNISVVLVSIAILLGAITSALGAYASYLRLKDAALRAAHDIIETKTALSPNKPQHETALKKISRKICIVHAATR